jgi:hypothetical protein
MKKSILIIGVPRSGTTSFLYCFYDNFEIYNEPTNTIIRKDYSTEKFMAMIKRNNIVVKTMADQIPFDYPERESNSSSMKFFSEIIPFFDKIILLDRKDVKSQLESYIRMVNQRTDNPDVLKGAIKHFYLNKFNIRELSEQYNLPIFYYEDIFYGDSKDVFKKLDIPLDWVNLEFLDRKYKYQGNIHFQKPKTIL